MICTLMAGIEPGSYAQAYWLYQCQGLKINQARVMCTKPAKRFTSERNASVGLPLHKVAGTSACAAKNQAFAMI